MSTLFGPTRGPIAQDGATQGASTGIHELTPASSGNRLWRRAPALVAAVIVLVAAALAAVVMPGSSPASGSARGWIATGWNIHLMNQAQPALAAQFFNTPGSYGTGSDPTNTPVLDGFATSPVLVYDSYAKFASDIKAGAITGPYQWVLYDPEEWSLTPLNEQQKPLTYLSAFGSLAHSHGYHVIETPARDLGNVSGSTCPKWSSETLNHWYIRCGIASAAAAASDILVVQDQANTTSLTKYDWLFANAQAQAQAANPPCAVYSEVSTSYGTPAEMANAALSVTADGYYVSISSSTITQAIQFFQAMS